MSCFIVSDRSINLIIAGFEQASTANTCQSAFYGILHDAQIIRLVGNRVMNEELAAKLRELNADAFHARYPQDKDPVHPATFFRVMPPTPVRLFKLLECLLYQCSEGREIPERPLFKELSRARDRLACNIVRATPEYSEADWD